VGPQEVLEELPEDWLVVMVEPREGLKKIDKIEFRSDFCIKLLCLKTYKQ
jgi:hypothetical protein